MAKVWQCDWCKTTAHNNSSWIKLDIEPMGPTPIGPPEFCSWQCIADYAEQKTKNQR